MRWIRMIVSVFLQFLFGIFAAGGGAGIIAILSHWKKADEEETGVLAVVGLLCAVAIFVGIKGVLVTKKRARGEQIDVIEWYEYKHRGAIGNILSGVLLVGVGIGWVLLIRQAAREVGDMPVWLGPIVVGIIQVIIGIGQFLSKKKSP